MIDAPTLTVGVEEEYLLVDLESRELVNTVPVELLDRCEDALGDRVSTEFLQCQIEIMTGVCDSMAQVRSELLEARRAVASVAADYGLAPIAASTHPLSTHLDVRRTERDRYATLADDLQAVVERLVICGMHVHVGIENADLRMDLMAQATYVLPHLLALTTSSPFWEGADTGLKSYRLAVWDELPRTGLPPTFSSWGEYQRHVDILVDSGVLRESTMLWWDIRPSAKFPTLEMRICDVCTNVDDAVAVAALYRCWLHFLWGLRRGNQRWRSYLPMLLNENRWLAQRNGVQASLADFGRGVLVPMSELIDEVSELISHSAQDLGCEDEIAHLKTIVARGTSADRQLAVRDAVAGSGGSHADSLRAVVDHLVVETVAG